MFGTRVIKYRDMRQTGRFDKTCEGIMRGNLVAPKGRSPRGRVHGRRGRGEERKVIGREAKVCPPKKANPADSASALTRYHPRPRRVFERVGLCSVGRKV
jgi:hypothetical protein